MPFKIWLSNVVNPSKNSSNKYSRIKFLPKKTVKEQLNDLYETYTVFNQPSPVFEYTYLWLKKQTCEIDDALVHGDFRLGNIIVSQDGLQSIRLGTCSCRGPLQDLDGFAGILGFGNTDKVVGGFGDLKDLLDGYNSISEYQVDQETVGHGKFLELSGGELFASYKHQLI